MGSCSDNDDYTGLLDNEEQEIRNFLKRVKADPVSVDWKTEGFYWYNNANNTPGECVDFIFTSVIIKLK